MLQSKPKMFRKDYEFLKKNCFFGKQVSIDTWLGLLTSLQKFESQKMNASIWRSALMKRKFFFQKIENLVKFFLQNERIQFRHSCQQFKAKSLYSCAQRPKKLKKIIIFPGEEVFLHGFPGQKKDVLTTLFQSSCWNPIFLLKVRTFS